MNADSLRLYQIGRETGNRLDVCAARVAENQDVMAASEFARWLWFSGILELLESNPQSEPLKVDGPFLRWKTKELIEACSDRFRTNSTEPKVSELQLQSIREKLDLIAGYLSRLSAADAVRVDRGEKPSEAVPVHSPLSRQELPVRREDYEQLIQPATQTATSPSKFVGAVPLPTEADSQSSGRGGSLLAGKPSEAKGS